MCEIKPEPSDLRADETVLEGQQVGDALNNLDSSSSDVPQTNGSEPTSSNPGVTTSDYGLDTDDELESAIKPDSPTALKRAGKMLEENTASNIVSLDTTVDASTPSMANRCIPIDDFEDSGYMSNEYEGSPLTILSPYSRVSVLGSSPLRHMSVEASPSQDKAQHPAESLRNDGHPPSGNDGECSISDSSDESTIDSITLFNALRPPRSPSPPNSSKSLWHEIRFETGLSDDDEFRRAITGSPVRKKSR